MWARSDRGGDSSLGWLEKVRSNSFEHATRQATSPAAASPVAASAHRTIDDDEHLAAYNDYLARLNQSGHDPAGR
jgi:hypothetical protein